MQSGVPRSGQESGKAKVFFRSCWSPGEGLPFGVVARVSRGLAGDWRVFSGSLGSLWPPGKLLGLWTLVWDPGKMCSLDSDDACYQK